MNARNEGVQLELVTVDADRATSNARALTTLVGDSVYGTIQNAAGKYAGRAQRLDMETLAAHFRGEISVAIRCADGDSSKFLSWDLDERAAERAHALRDVLRRHDLLKHAIFTEGSDPGRGKVIVFHRRAPQERASELAADIMTQAAMLSPWGISTRPGAAQSKPESGAGGLVRIGGRNRGRNGPIERIISLETGEPIALSQVEIADLDLRPMGPQPVAMPRLAPYVSKLLTNGLPWPPGGNAAVRPILMRLAFHAVRTGRGRATFTSWIDEIRKHPNTLSGRSPKSGDIRSPLTINSLDAVWAAAVRKSPTVTLHRPGGRSPRCNVTPPSVDGPHVNEETAFVTVLRSWVATKDLHPDAFACSYREIARVIGASPRQTHRIAARCIAKGLVILVDRGTQGERGDKSIWSFASNPQAAERREVVLRRRRKQVDHVAAMRKKMVDLATVRERISPSISPWEGALVAAHGDEEGRGPRAAARYPIPVQRERRRWSNLGGGGEPHEAICGCSDCRRGPGGANTWPT